MVDMDSKDILGLIDSIKGEILCKECVKGDGRENIPEEELITRDRIESNDLYVCGRCDKQL